MKMSTNDSMLANNVESAAVSKAEKKARKEAKRAKKAAQAAAQETAQDGLGATVDSVQSNGNGTAEKEDVVGADGVAAQPELEADAALKAASSSSKKDKKKDKKRKREEADAQAQAATTPAQETTPDAASAPPAASAAPEEGVKEKKKRKKSVKGAFGNDAKKAEAAAAAAPAVPASSTSASSSSSIPTLSQAEIDAFMSADDGVTYTPETASSTYPPILQFAHLPVSKGIKDGLKAFAKPTTVQSASWGVQLRGDADARPRDCVSIASTGWAQPPVSEGHHCPPFGLCDADATHSLARASLRSGKTLAFGVPILHQILTSPPTTAVTALIVAPTRELAMQTQTNLGAIGEALKIGIVCIYGGDSKAKQIGLLQKKPRIVVGTPGRILDLCNEGNLDLSAVSWLVLDEADRMLDRGFENDIRSIIGQCRPSTSSAEGRITSMFSATWPMSVRKLAGDFMQDPVRITVGSDELSVNTSIKQTVIVLDQREKDRRLLDVLRQQGYPAPSRYGGGGGNASGGVKSKGTQTGAARDKVLVFALYKKEAARVAQWLERQGYEVGCIQGDMSQDKRTQALEDFRTGKTGFLVATDVAARGLDIPKVELVGGCSLCL